MKKIHHTDQDGDRLTLEESTSFEGTFLVTVETSGGAYVTAEDLRDLADQIDAHSGVIRKATDETPEPISEDRVAMIEAAKDLLRRAAPSDGDLVVFLGEG